MSKINKITLSNFKFFGKEDSINLDGKHMLLYGENGSGKSSIYWGLYTLLESAMKDSVDVQKYFESDNAESLVNIYAQRIIDAQTQIEHANSYIAINTENGQYSMSLLRNNVCGSPAAKESRKASDFINYQSIFKFQDFRNSETPDLYNVFASSILPYVNFATFNGIKGKNLSNAGEMWKSYTEGPGKTINRNGDEIQVYKSSPEYKQFLDFERHFHTEFLRLIDFINTNAQDNVQKLGYNIQFHLELTSASHFKGDTRYSYTPFQVKLFITEYNGNPIRIERPQTFLNEAKMSAIATAIRLSILDFRINSAAADALKVLILDDIMISLDMSNREKLMDLLLDKYSTTYQILFFTHDQNLYNFVDSKIKQKKQNELWLRKEMHIGENDSTHMEFPVLINGECEPIEKARKYYVSRDYVVSGLFIRKAIEKLIVTLLPKELFLRPDGSFVELQTLWEKLKDFYSHNGLSVSTDTIHLFEDSKLLVLNPAAHFQRFATPVYKNELINAFSLYDELSKLPKLEKEFVIPKGAVAEFNAPHTPYYCRFEFDNDFIIIEGDNIISRMPKCKNIYWKYNGIDYYDFETGAQNLDHPFKTATPKLNKFLEGITQKIPLGITEELFMENCMINGTNLNEYFEGVKISSLILSSTEA